ncbi:MAG: hypothetical protein WDZ40_04075 [Candidatus Spechtbacterales bacterium]
MNNPILEIFLETAEALRPALLAEGLSQANIQKSIAEKSFLIGVNLQKVAEVNMQAGREQGMALAIQQMQQRQRPASEPPQAELSSQGGYL